MTKKLVIIRLFIFLKLRNKMHFLSRQFKTDRKKMGALSGRQKTISTNE